MRKLVRKSPGQQTTRSLKSRLSDELWVTLLEPLPKKRVPHSKKLEEA
jgi:hypothetical protein